MGCGRKYVYIPYSRFPGALHMKSLALTAVWAVGLCAGQAAPPILSGPRSTAPRTGLSTAGPNAGSGTHPHVHGVLGGARHEMLQPGAQHSPVGTVKTDDRKDLKASSVVHGGPPELAEHAQIKNTSRHRHRTSTVVSEPSNSGWGINADRRVLSESTTVTPVMALGGDHVSTHGPENVHEQLQRVDLGPLPEVQDYGGRDIKTGDIDGDGQGC